MSLSKMIRIASEAGMLTQDRFSPSQWAYLQAKTKNDSAAIAFLTKMAIAGLPTGAHYQRGVQKLVRIMLGQQISMVSVRTDLRCKMDECERQREKVREVIASIRAEVMTILDRHASGGRSESPIAETTIPAL